MERKTATILRVIVWKYKNIQLGNIQFQAPPNSGYFVSRFATSACDLEMVANHFQG